MLNKRILLISILLLISTLDTSILGYKGSHGVTLDYDVEIFLNNLKVIGESINDVLDNVPILPAISFEFLSVLLIP